MMEREPLEFFGYLLQPELIALIIGFIAAPIYICILHAFPVYFRARVRRAPRARRAPRKIVVSLEKMYEEKFGPIKKRRFGVTIHKNGI